MKRKKNILKASQSFSLATFPHLSVQSSYCTLAVYCAVTNEENGKMKTKQEVSGWKLFTAEEQYGQALSSNGAEKIPLQKKKDHDHDHFQSLQESLTLWKDIVNDSKLLHTDIDPILWNGKF